MAVFAGGKLLEGQKEVFMHAPLEHFPLALEHIRGIGNVIGIWENRLEDHGKLLDRGKYAFGPL